MNEPARRAAELRTLLARLSHQQETLDSVSVRLKRAISRSRMGDDPEAIAADALPAFEDLSQVSGEGSSSEMP